MGDIADMIINGDMCELCGTVFCNGGHGFPRKCSDCAKQKQRNSSYVKTVKVAQVNTKQEKTT